MSIKYAYTVLSIPFPFLWEFDTFKFNDRTQIRKGSVKDQIQTPDSKHWSEWIGSLAWDQVCKEKVILLNWIETENPDILDHENVSLEMELSTRFRILPLVAPLTPPFEEVFRFTGKGQLSENVPRADDIRSFSRLNCWKRSYYNEHYWDEFQKWAKIEVMKPDLLEKWKTCYDHYDRLFIQKKSNRQLFESYRSFEEAMKGSQLEFKIPNLVRAIECIIDCRGAEQFSEKVLFLIGTPDKSLPYDISTNTEELLKDLYQLRNDCSHGKPFAYSLENKLGKAPDGSLIAKYEFLAEWAARKTINDSFSNASILEHSHSRKALVEAWRNKLIIP